MTAPPQNGLSNLQLQLAPHPTHCYKEVRIRSIKRGSYLDMSKVIFARMVWKIIREGEVGTRYITNNTKRTGTSEWSTKYRGWVSMEYIGWVSTECLG